MVEKVSVVKCNSYDEKLVLEKVREALDLIGFKIKQGSKVLLKPNVLSAKSPDEAITTHPALINAICRILKEKKCKISIGDSSGIGIKGTREAFKKTGIEEIAHRYNAEIIPFEESKIVYKKIDSKIVKGIHISKSLLDADFIINMPKLKTHTLVGYTGAVKNMFGIIPGGKKIDYHKTCGNQKNFAELLVDIYLLRKPDLNIMDGIVGMEGNGPAAGKIKKTGIVIASKDGIALDFVAAKIIGFKTDDILTNKALVKRNLKPEIEVVGEKNIRVRYEQPIKTVRKAPGFLVKAYYWLINPKIKVNKKLCKKCLVCVKACPVNAISFANKKIKINKKKCILCYCCHELCPEKAIIIRKSFIARFITSLKNWIKKVIK
ncbi:MAG: DUF362 domain-containing protein [Candidatus Omnitrophica bacterium]|nr:DUF362 domain-containing protein [Candidatus Omnitrophota bacterium]